MFLDAQCSCHFLSCGCSFLPWSKTLSDGQFFVFILCRKHFEHLDFVTCLWTVIEVMCKLIPYPLFTVEMVNEQKYIYIYIYIYIITWNIILLLFHQWKVKDPRVKLLLLNVWDCLWFHFIWELVFKRFFDPEMKILSSFTHPNVVTRRNVFIFRTKIKIF